MKGICFIEEMFDLVIQGIKTQTRRIANGKPRYNVGDLVYLKEPYKVFDDFILLGNILVLRLC
jgi:hypothetical protein